jgi:hypothetical protein
MKQTKELKMVALHFFFLALPVLGLNSAFGTTHLGASCPQKFIATVTNIEELPISTFPKVEVDFQVIQVITGDRVASRKIQVVKNGPVQFKNGEIYTIESRENWLCSATLFSKI